MYSRVNRGSLLADCNTTVLPRLAAFRKLGNKIKELSYVKDVYC